MKIRSALILTALASSHIQSVVDDSSKKHIPHKLQYHQLESPSITEYTRRAQEMIYRFKEKVGCPGISVCVSLSGNIIYQEGVGYANVEHMVPVNADTVFRIASVSKPFTSLLVGRLLDQHKLDLDEDICSYYPEFPEKIIDNAYARITVRSLLNHTSGIRSYKKVSDESKESAYPEMLNNIRFKNTFNACDMFKNDALVHAPGVQYTYSTFAFTLLSAIIEKICLLKGGPFDQPIPTVKGEPSSEKTDSTSDLPKWARFDTNLLRLFQYLNLNNTSLEYPEKIISSRAARSGDPATDENFYPDRLYALHTGGAVGGTTILLLSLPLLNDNKINEINTSTAVNNRNNNSILSMPKMYPQDIRMKFANLPPINVAILTNLENVPGISELAIYISEIFLEYALKMEQANEENS
ncbi:Esterase EstB [Schistosoma japonicum]|nr:Esterase EstB [Schistosoma japonicum]